MSSDVGHRACPRRGFPIRTSSDHSSVASSSRLIAGSYVLHRLLVPRHPPCALKNLTTNKRCSRPLYSSQTTDGPGPTPHAHPHHTRAHARHATRTVRGRPHPHTKDNHHTPTHHPHHAGRQATRTGSLRTQQRATRPNHPADPLSHPPPPSPPKKEHQQQTYSRHPPDDQTTHRRPTHEQTLPGHKPETEPHPGHHTHPPHRDRAGHRCARRSLERR